jgi:hypothetical protein
MKKINLDKLKKELVRVRKDANNWTPEYRKYLLEMGMKIVNGECKEPYVGSMP